MAVLQMQKFSICALKKDRNAILKKLQSLGCTEIEKIFRKMMYFLGQIHRKKLYGKKKLLWQKEHWIS